MFMVVSFLTLTLRKSPLNLVFIISGRTIVCYLEQYVSTLVVIGNQINRKSGVHQFQPKLCSNLIYQYFKKKHFRIFLSVIKVCIIPNTYLVIIYFCMARTHLYKQELS